MSIHSQVMTQQQNTILIKSLQNKALYDHTVLRFEVFETHISWVILTGPYAYKIKKPVNLGFLDFSTLDKRRFYCEEEVRLNRRLAPQLYIGMVRITGDPERPQLEGAGPAIEYAVKMHQFDQSTQLDRMLSGNLLTPEHIDRVAEILAEFHRTADVAAKSMIFGTPDAITNPVMENFYQIQPLLSDKQEIKQLQRIRQWSERTHRHLARNFRSRKEHGFIRECHGDMHLANIALYRNDIVIFDCLEFNDNLRWVDVMSEAAFLMMDLDKHGYHPLACRFLNGYLQYTGDYECLTLLPYYLVYRAMVRAKVACIHQAQAGLQQTEKDNAQKQYRNYLNLAEQYTCQQPAALIITHGLSGSGKTTITQLLLERCGAVRVRSDIERKRLYGLSAGQKSQSGIDTGLYTAQASEQTYQHLAHLAGAILAAGYPAIIDAAFLKSDQRNIFQALAEKTGVSYIILDFQAPEALLRKWIIERAKQAHDASEADIPVLEHQLATQEPLTQEELEYSLTVNTGQSLDMDELADTLRRSIKENG